MLISHLKIPMEFHIFYIVWTLYEPPYMNHEVLLLEYFS